MDFASLMTEEISKARTKTSTAESTSGTVLTEPQPPSSSKDSSKYVRRGDLEANRIAAYKEEQERREHDRNERAAQKRKVEEEEAERRREREEKKRRLAEESKKRREAEEEQRERERRKKLGLPELPRQSSSDRNGAPLDGGEEDAIEDEDLITKLRDLGEPATLFGEGHNGRLRRYHRLMRKMQQKNGATKKLSNGPIPTSLELLPEKDMRVPPKPPKDREGRHYLFRQLASYFTMVLEEWERALGKRDISVKDSFSGKQAYNAMVQARENMKPLFAKFEQGEIDDSILEAIVEIVNCAQDRRYVDANDGYLRLSIGKAAWPIGVTMVGIHERSAREKLHEGDKGQAHIMSDESTRKYLQSIKRCLSYAQVRWPPDDPIQLMG